MRKLLLISIIIFFWPSISSAKVFFNEVCWMGSLESSSDEWIELYNDSDSSVLLDNWVIIALDGQPDVTLSGEIMPESFFLIERTNDESAKGVMADMFYTGSLGNTGEDISLYDQGGVLQDRIEFSSEWPAGDNDEKFTMEFFENNWFTSLSIGGSPREINSNHSSGEYIEREDSDKIEKISSSLSRKEYDNKYKNIVLSEIFPNPNGLDIEDEFIEIFNKGIKRVNLKGLSLSDEAGFLFKVEKNLYLPAYSWITFFRIETKIALNNSGDTVYLKNGDSLISKISYSQAEEGYSYNLSTICESEECRWFWDRDESPGEENNFKIPNLEPLIDFSFPKEIFSGIPIFFDSSDTIDPEEENLSFFWDFGDGFTNTLEYPQHVFLDEGEYTITLKVNDSENEVFLKKNLEVKEILLSINELKVNARVYKKGDVLITEFLPNPEGDDNEGEYIEIFNPNSERLNLIGWQIDDIEGGSKPYYFDSDLFIEEKGFLVINRTDSGLALNNSYDQVRLIDPSKNEIDVIKYSGGKENEAFVRNGLNWQWSDELSPGFKNNITKESGRQSENKGSENYFDETGVKPLQNGNKIIVEGLVLVEPNIFSDQYFYIQGFPGFQIYSYSKNFPLLERGDLISVSGVLSQISGADRIKIKEAGSIIVLKKNQEIPLTKIDIENISDNYNGSLLEIYGNVISKKSSGLVLKNKTSQIEVLIKNGTNISLDNFKEGDELFVRGVGVKYNSLMKILPRNFGDISLVKKNTTELNGDSAPEEWFLEKREKDNSYIGYFVVTCVFVFLLFVFKK